MLFSGVDDPPVLPRTASEPHSITISSFAAVRPVPASARSSCVHRCNDQYKSARKAEENRSRAAIKACKSDKVCKKQQQALKKSNIDALSQERKRCKRNCYNEGAGVGGR